MPAAAFGTHQRTMDKPPPTPHTPPPTPLTCTVGVGGWVVRPSGEVLLARMTYGPAKGLLMIPGGHAEPDEFLDDTAVREVREETGVETVCRGVLLVRQRTEQPCPNLYFVMLMTPVDDHAGAPDGTEISELAWLTPEQILARDDVQTIARELAAAYAAAPAQCLHDRALAWQPRDRYRLWSGPSGRPGGPPS